MERQIEELNRSLPDGSAEAVNLHGLARSLAAARRRHVREAVSRRSVVLKDSPWFSTDGTNAFQQVD